MKFYFPTTFVIAICLFSSEINTYALSHLDRREQAVQSELEKLTKKREKLFAQIKKQAPISPEVQGDAEALLNEYLILESKFPDHKPLKLNTIILLYELGEVQHALNRLNSWLDAEPQNVQLLLLQGKYLAELGQHAEAAKALQSALILAPGELQSHFIWGEFLSEYRKTLLDKKIFERAQELDSALQGAFRVCVALNPKSQEYLLRYLLSFFEIEKPNWNAALASVNQLEKLLPAEKNSPPKSLPAEEKTRLFKESLLLYKARIYAELCEFEAAESSLQKSQAPQFENSRQKIKQIIISKKNKS